MPTAPDGGHGAADGGKRLTDYDRAWIADMQELFNRYTTNLINETSMQLLGYNQAGVKNYPLRWTKSPGDPDRGAEP